MIRCTLIIFWGVFGLLNFCSEVILGQNFTTHFHAYGVEDGLSHRFVNVIEQDQKGFIWVGTNYGLNRFDGQEFKVYDLSNVITQERQISNIQFDTAGRLWLRFNRGSNDAFNVFDPTTEQLLTVEEAIGQALPERVKENMLPIPLSDGRILMMGAKKENIYFWEGDQLRIVPFSLQDEETLDVVQEYQPGLYWVNTTYADPGRRCRALLLNDQGQVLQEHHINSPNCKILYQKEDSLYVLNEADHLIYRCVKNQPPEALSYKNAALQKVKHRANRVQSQFLFKDPKRPEILQIRNYDGRLLQEVSLDYIDKFNSFDINTSFLDREGAIWFANFNYFSLGYIQIRKNFFRKYLYEYRSTNNALQSTRGIVSYKDSLLFVNSFTDCFQIELKSGKITPLNFPKDINDIANLSGMLGHEEYLWTVSSNGFLCSYHIPSQKIKLFPIRQKKGRKSVPHTQLLSIHRSPTGKLLIGGKRGLFYLDTLRQAVLPYEHYGQDSMLANSVVNFIYENEEGYWYCTSTGLYWQQDANTIIRYHPEAQAPHQLPYHLIAYLHEDSKGIFWLATKGGGLLRWDRNQNSIEQFTTQQGLSHNVIYAIFEDNRQNLWMSSDRGIMQFNKKTRGVVTFLPRDGITHEEFNTYSYHQSSDGSVYFGGLNGVTAFHPRQFEKTANYQVPFLITQFKVKNSHTKTYQDKTQELLNSHQIKLQPGQSSFVLQFALLDYAAPRQIRYAYKVGGLDQDWTISTEGVLRLNQLPYGNYQIYLRAQSPDGQWVDYPKPIELKVLQPFYTQLWFILLCGLLFVAIIYAVFKLRLRYLEQKQKELEQIVQDRTAKIEQDRQLIEQQSEELKALDKAKSRFFANVSHELRTPLTLILGPLSYILDQPQALEEDELRNQLRRMRRNGKNLLELVEEIMDLSKMEAHQLTLQEDPVLLGDYFEQAFRRFETQFQNQQLQARLQIPKHLQQRSILLDVQKFDKILNNYLSNAVKFTPEGGSIELKISEQDGHLCLSVADTGQGIPAKDLPHVFERFYQASQDREANYGGTGIGLALVHEYAKLMQGKAYAESTLSKGSCFYFEWPMREVEALAPITKQVEEQLEEEAIASIGTDFTILLVEDNEDMRAFVLSVLTPYYKVITANHGLEGIAQLEENATQIDLVISDIMMPKMDGFELLKTIKSHESWYKIPVVMLTALHAEKEKLQALTIGVDDYLTKPFSVPELLVRVQNLLYNYHQRQQWQSEENEDPSAAETEQDTEQAWVQSIESKVLELLPEQSPSVEELAQAFFLSSRQFHRRLKQATGLTPAKFIREVQLQKARDLLEAGRAISVSHTAYSCGFNTPDTFSRLYKKRFGKSPGGYL